MHTKDQTPLTRDFLASSNTRLSYLAMMVGSLALAGVACEESKREAESAYRLLVTSYCRDPRRATREETIATHRAILAWCIGKTAGLCNVN